MERRPSKRVTIGSAMALLLIAGAFIATGIGVTTYFELVQLHLEVGDATSRLESAARGRAELAANLLRIAPRLARVDRERLAAVEPLVDEARRDALAPDAAERSEMIAPYLERQHELGRRLDEFWGGVSRPASAAARDELDDLRTKLERAGADVRASAERLVATLGSYDSAVSGFPGSVIAGGVRFEGRPLRQASTGRGRP